MYIVHIIHASSLIFHLGMILIPGVGSDYPFHLSKVDFDAPLNISFVEMPNARRELCTISRVVDTCCCRKEEKLSCSLSDIDIYPFSRKANEKDLK